MRNAMKFILATATAVLVMLVVRAYAFTVYRVSDNNLCPALKKNDRVVVNRLPCGIVEDVPGDTVAIDGSLYILPERCGCQKCGCSRRAVFMVSQGKERALLHRDDIIGKAFKISLAIR